MNIFEKIQNFFRFLLLGDDYQKTKKITSRRGGFFRKKEEKPGLEKYLQNPIIEPDEKNAWEAWQTFNPGAILIGDSIHFMYRAIGHDGISRFGYARSSDGLSIERRLLFPAFQHRVSQTSLVSFASGGSFGGAEDPRLVRVDDEDRIYMTYTACDGGLRVGLTSILVDDFIKHDWLWKKPKLISTPGETHKNWVIFPKKINGKYAILHSLNPEIQIAYLDDLEFTSVSHVQSYFRSEEQKGCWDKWIRGVGATPLYTEKGWLVFYHAMDDDWSKYKVGAMLLDLNDPTKILHRSKKPILVPDETYENCGFKSGVVYLSGAVIKNGTLFLYYGGADSYVCVAHEDINSFLAELMREESPHLNKKTLTKK